jgi:Ca2+-transporting ATPase
VLLGWPLIIFPLQIVVMELIIDPACSTVFESEPEEKGTMARPPRDARESVFSRQAVIVSVAQGCSILLICLGVFLLAWRYYGAPQPGQPWVPATMAFVTLVIANLALIQANVSWSRSIIATLRSNNRPMWIVSGGAGLLLAALLLVPFLRGLFGLATLTPSDIAVCLGAGVVGVIWFEVLKFALARQPQARQA